MNLPILDRDKIDYFKPTFTLDVNSVALKHPKNWPPFINGLAQLEYNYFEYEKIELCVTPQTQDEILQGYPISSLGSTAYSRFQKSQFFKSRPKGTTLSYTEQEADDVWLEIRQILFPSVNDENLFQNHRADITQLFYHLTVSGTLANSAFLTTDTNFHNHSSEIKSELGVTIMNPHQAWEEYQPKYGLYIPKETEIDRFWENQNNYFQKLWSESEK